MPRILYRAVQLDKKLFERYQFTKRFFPMKFVLRINNKRIIQQLFQGNIEICRHEWSFEKLWQQFLI